MALSFPPGSGGFINPEAVISQLQVQEGMKVADLGCGHGYFSIPLAKMVGESGRVISFDVLTDALENVKSKAQTQNLKNIETFRANLEKEGGTGLDDGECDMVVLANILYQSQKKEAIIREALRILKTGGWLLVVEWQTKDLTIGPQEGWRIGPQELKEMVQNQKGVLQKEIKAGDFHYGLVFVK